MFSYREGLIIAVIATAFILSSAHFENCDTSGCSPCPQPLNSAAYCTSKKMMFVPKSSICACCDQCARYLKSLESCTKDLAVYFPRIGGGTSAVVMRCAPGSKCSTRGYCIKPV